MQENSFQTVRMPMIALRGLVVFPGMLLTFDVERPASVAALAEAGKGEQLIFLASQKDISVDIPRKRISIPSARSAGCVSSCVSHTAASAA